MTRSPCAPALRNGNANERPTSPLGLNPGRTTRQN
jgi:hypothetical protein